MAILEYYLNSNGQLREYINYDHILSYGFRHNFLVGARGKGKTYGLTKWLLRKCINEGKKFIWVRNTTVALEQLTDNNGVTFLADHLGVLGFDNDSATLSKNILRYENQIIGTFISLAAFAKLKGNNYDDHTYFIFDEFMPERGETIRVDYEYALMSIMQSVFRERTDFIAFYMANVLKTASNILDFFSFKILPHFEGQSIQRNRKLSAVMFYFQNEDEDNKKEQVGDAFALANKYTKDSIILDYKLNVDSECNRNIRRSQLLMYLVDDRNYFLLREYKEKIAVIRVKGISASYRLPVYALNKKYVFGNAIFNTSVRQKMLDMWNNNMFIFRTEYTLLQFITSLFLQ